MSISRSVAAHPFVRYQRPRTATEESIPGTRPGGSASSAPVVLPRRPRTATDVSSDIEAKACALPILVRHAAPAVRHVHFSQVPGLLPQVVAWQERPESKAAAQVQSLPSRARAMTRGSLPVGVAVAPGARPGTPVSQVSPAPVSASRPVQVSHVVAFAESSDLPEHPDVGQGQQKVRPRTRKVHFTQIVKLQHAKAWQDVQAPAAPAVATQSALLGRAASQVLAPRAVSPGAHRAVSPRAVSPVALYRQQSPRLPMDFVLPGSRGAAAIPATNVARPRANTASAVPAARADIGRAGMALPHFGADFPMQVVKRRGLQVQ